MRSRGVIVTLAVILLLLFTVINWPSLAVQLPLNLIFFQVQAPLGLLLVAFALLLSFLFLLLSLFRRAGQLRQISQLESELLRERARLEKKRLAEFEALEAHLGERFGALEAGVKQVMAEQSSRLEARERGQVERLEAQVLAIRSELATDLSQIETSIKRSLPPTHPPENGRD
jgi:uncharacterized integral membrane protein